MPGHYHRNLQCRWDCCPKLVLIGFDLLWKSHPIPWCNCVAQIGSRARCTFLNVRVVFWGCCWRSVASSNWALPLVVRCPNPIVHLRWQKARIVDLNSGGCRWVFWCSCDPYANGSQLAEYCSFPCTILNFQARLAFVNILNPTKMLCLN